MIYDDVVAIARKNNLEFTISRAKYGAIMKKSKNPVFTFFCLECGEEITIRYKEFIVFKGHTCKYWSEVRLYNHRKEFLLKYGLIPMLGTLSLYTKHKFFDERTEIEWKSLITGEKKFYKICDILNGLVRI